MKQWEYQLIDSKDVEGGGIFRGPDRDKLIEHLNHLGHEGWEIVAADFLELDSRHSFVAIAKREVGAGAS